ncbi:hypothetical protein [Lacticaseibacillus saniviri]|nr:hypothetical protein [Lacticaseibacillus saniviri]MCG4281780.1 hypothetical protein [Lacticaseibacillus saniviri]
MDPDNIDFVILTKMLEERQNQALQHDDTWDDWDETDDWEWQVTDESED